MFVEGFAYPRQYRVVLGSMCMKDEGIANEIEVYTLSECGHLSQDMQKTNYYTEETSIKIDHLHLPRKVREVSGIG